MAEFALGRRATFPLSVTAPDSSDRIEEGIPRSAPLPSLPPLSEGSIELLRQFLSPYTDGRLHFDLTRRLSASVERDRRDYEEEQDRQLNLTSTSVEDTDSDIGEREGGEESEHQEELTASQSTQPSSVRATGLGILFGGDFSTAASLEDETDSSASKIRADSDLPHHPIEDGQGSVSSCSSSTSLGGEDEPSIQETVPTDSQNGSPNLPTSPAPVLQDHFQVRRKNWLQIRFDKRMKGKKKEQRTQSSSDASSASVNQDKTNGMLTNGRLTTATPSSPLLQYINTDDFEAESPVQKGLPEPVKPRFSDQINEIWQRRGRKYDSLTLYEPREDFHVPVKALDDENSDVEIDTPSSLNLNEPYRSPRLKTFTAFERGQSPVVTDTSKKEYFENQRQKLINTTKMKHQKYGAACRYPRGIIAFDSVEVDQRLKIKKLESKIVGLQNRIEDSEMYKKSSKENIKSLQSKFDAEHMRVQSLESDLSTLQAELDELVKSNRGTCRLPEGHEAETESDLAEARVANDSWAEHYDALLARTRALEHEVERHHERRRRPAGGPSSRARPSTTSQPSALSSDIYSSIRNLHCATGGYSTASHPASDPPSPTSSLPSSEDEGSLSTTHAHGPSQGYSARAAMELAMVERRHQRRVAEFQELCDQMKLMREALWRGDLRRNRAEPVTPEKRVPRFEDVPVPLAFQQARELRRKGVK